MRPVEVLEIARELLPRRGVQKVNIVTVLALLATGTFDDVVVSFVSWRRLRHGWEISSRYSSD